MAETTNGKPMPWQRTPEGREKMRKVMKARWANRDPSLMKGARRSAKIRTAKAKPKRARKAPRRRAAAAPGRGAALTRELRALAAGSVKLATSGRAGSAESVEYIYTAVEGLLQHHAESTGCDPGDIKTRIGLMLLLNR